MYFRGLTVGCIHRGVATGAAATPMRSRWAATRRQRSSRQGAATTWTPIGSPSASLPIGTLAWDDHAAHQRWGVSAQQGPLRAWWLHFTAHT